MKDRAIIPITSEGDIVRARQLCRDAAKKLGFGLTDQARIATGVSELARNIILYAGKGEIVCSTIIGFRRGIEIVASDQGPGICDPGLALTDGFTTSSGLGLGLPGTRRLMDELDIETAPGQGTRVIVRKWII